MSKVCEFKPDGARVCGRLVTHRLILRVTDRGDREPTEHYYCLFHGPIAQANVIAAAASAGRSEAVNARLERIDAS